MTNLTAKYNRILQAKIDAQSAYLANVAKAKATLAEAEAYKPIVLSMLASTRQSIQDNLNKYST